MPLNVIFYLTIAFLSQNTQTFVINCNGHIYLQHLYGVPRLYGWIMDTVPFVTKTLASSKIGKNIDCLYLDLNGIYHPATHGNVPIQLDIGQSQRFKRIFTAISNIYSIIKPKKLLYLASDGVCPAAKINQQRTRRNRSSIGNIQDQINPERFANIQKQLETVLSSCGDNRTSTQPFTPNMISPGTEFIVTLENELRKWLFLKVSEGFFGNCDVVFSGSDVPGEGEHKIFQSIKSASRLSSMVYGLDADLMLLASLTQGNKCIILREKRGYTPHVAARRKPNPYYNSTTGLVHFHKRDFLTLQKRHFELVNLKAVAMHFYNRLVTKDKKKINYNGSEDDFVNSLTRDFVFLTFLAGNDFLPRVPAVDLADESFTPFILSYFKNFDQIGGFITNGDSYSISRFKKFLEFPSTFEQNWFRLRGLKLGIAEFTTNEYAKYYYKIKFGVDVTDQPEFIKGLVNDYLTGLHWNMFYYNRSYSCWNWSYKHHYAPLLTDMCKYKYKFNKQMFKNGKPVSQLTHLLSVCPPEDNYLLPEQLRDIDELNQYFPSDVEVDKDGYNNEWEYVVKMPFIDPQEVQNVVTNRLGDKPLKNPETERNRYGAPIHLKYNKPRK
ncbi:XRN 5-3 exonuclease N-terminus [Babesia microti strain RI]|uniref:XRN 5-3 exonuclease N-terminus n=1 Tax=Babesia microti (strain RI) TaxID=1133968 RepID=A0A1R4ACC0_BABMR|nr:XRN 5-3 exonuclease N-terminus [Babesia microti strain RI]SJK86630.1 XRN 5-3 exonuclease N-terminus [Babesia microti strain RI]|eukprot:XP_021338765.1 XRN 5-3 exonuclease N-terminus [Babesia microti strain RI]